MREAIYSGVESEGDFELTDEEFVTYVERLLNQPGNFVGKGNIAEVYVLDSNRRICVKFTDESETGGTVSYALRGERPYFNSVQVEANFLNDLQDIDEDVRVPKPYYFLKKYLERHSADSAFISVLAMELLDAVSVRDILDGREEMPEHFDISSFCSKLEHFFEKMHQKGIYHRDVHSGNIMIGRKHGEPYVIDFGTATYSNVEDAYRGSYRGSQTPFRDDMFGLRLVRSDLQKILTEITR